MPPKNKARRPMAEELNVCMDMNFNGYVTAFSRIHFVIIKVTWPGGWSAFFGMN